MDSGRCFAAKWNNGFEVVAIDRVYFTPIEMSLILRWLGIVRKSAFLAKSMNLPVAMVDGFALRVACRSSFGVPVLIMLGLSGIGSMSQSPILDMKIY